MGSSESGATLKPRRLRANDAGAQPLRCTVGLLTWNAGPELETCLKALLAQTEPKIDFIWLDNGSQTDYAETRGKFPQLKPPERNARNVGFCAGHNAMLAVCRSPYYLALNQDAALDADYIRIICDWLDKEPKLALVSGLIVMSEKTKRGHYRIDSAGLVWPRLRYPFNLGEDWPLPRQPEFREATGVAGAAMVLRVDACRQVSRPQSDIFPSEFFAYHEEIDLAQRLGRAGYGCGVAGKTRVRHVGGSSGGRRNSKIIAGIFANHWLLTVRHDPLAWIVRELPWIVWGELYWWAPRYLKSPWAFIMAIGKLLRCFWGARAFYWAFERKHGSTRKRLSELRRRAKAELEQPQTWKGTNTS